MKTTVAIAVAALVACQPREPSSKEPATAAATAKPAAEPNEGEVRADAVAAHKLGAPAPALVVKTVDGETIDLAKLYGHKPVYLKFWATWCIPCREQMPGFERIYEAMGDRMAVIAVNAGLDDSEAAVRAFRDQHGLRMPVVVDDGRLAQALDLQVTPQHVVIGRDAKIAYVGHLDGDKLDQAIAKVLAAPAPAGASGATGEAVTTRPALRPGDLVQGLEATTIDGARRTLARDGRPSAVVLFMSSCESYLKDSRPGTSQACRRVREQVDQLIGAGDVEWLGVAHGLWSSVEGVAKYRERTHTKLTLALDADGSLFRAFGVHDIPTVALIDRGGRLIRLVGPDEPDLAGAVRALVAQN